jgi:alginate O-acetyltransferase complex protein AlgI
MLFNSYVFIFKFLPLLLLSYYLLCKLNKFSLAKLVIVIASLYFYAFMVFKNFYIITGSIVFNYIIGSLIAKNKSRVYLTIGVIGNISLLGYYKYTNFMVDNINRFLNVDITMNKILLPLGISFFVFQQIGYLTDVYGDPSIKYKFLDYCVFVSFFPQLVAGPIVSHDEIIPQFNNKENFKPNLENICKGLFMLSIGFAKKILIADYLSAKVKLGFDTLQSLTFMQGWISSISYTLQLYFDFSGYCDMAIGIGLLFNIVLPFNFLSPYKAASIKEFWNKWHITLSRFLTGNIYFPLGGNRKGKLRTYFNLFVVFFVSGLWHGAGWTFILWGILHGAATIIHRIWRDLDFKMNRLLGWFITINFVNAAWVFFRALSFKDAFKVLKAMMNFGNITHVQNLHQFGGVFYLVLLTLLIMLVLATENSGYWLESITLNSKYAFAIGVLMTIAVLSINKLSEFIYFNF